MRIRKEGKKNNEQVELDRHSITSSLGNSASNKSVNVSGGNESPSRIRPVDIKDDSNVILEDDVEEVTTVDEASSLEKFFVLSFLPGVIQLFERVELSTLVDLKEAVGDKVVVSVEQDEKGHNCRRHHEETG